MACEIQKQICLDDINRERIMKPGYDDLALWRQREMTVKEVKDWETPEERACQRQYKKRIAKHIIACQQDDCKEMQAAWSSDRRLGKWIRAAEAGA